MTGDWWPLNHLIPSSSALKHPPLWCQYFSHAAFQELNSVLNRVKFLHSEDIFQSVWADVWFSCLHIRVSKSSQPLALENFFALCPSGLCHLPSGSIPLHYRPPSVPHLNNSSPATPCPLRHYRHCCSRAHRQPQTARAFINRWQEKERERERLVRGGKLFQNSRAGLRLRTPQPPPPPLRLLRSGVTLGWLNFAL